MLATELYFIQVKNSETKSLFTIVTVCVVDIFSSLFTGIVSNDNI